MKVQEVQRYSISEAEAEQPCRNPGMRQEKAVEPCHMFWLAE